MSPQLKIISSTLFFPLIANAYPSLLFQSADFSGRIDFSVELPVTEGSYGYYNSDILSNWQILYSNGATITPSNTLSSPGYRQDGKYVGLGFYIGNTGLLQTLEFYVENTSGDYFDLDIRRNATGDLVEDFGRGDATLIQNAIPVPSTFILLVAGFGGWLLSRNRKGILSKVFSNFKLRY